MPAIASIGTEVRVTPENDVQIVSGPGKDEFTFTNDRSPFSVRVAGLIEEAGEVIGVFGDVISGHERYQGQVATLLVRLEHSNWRRDNRSAANFKVGRGVARRNSRHPFYHPEGTDIDGFPFIIRFGSLDSRIGKEPEVNSALQTFHDRKPLPLSSWPEMLDKSEFPAAWEAILQKRVAFDRFLSEADRRELRSYIRWFLASKPFVGCGGLVITDEIRVTIAAQACLLLLHRETPCYERLRSVHVWPGTDFPETSTKTLLGEFWEQGIIVLAWDSVRCGAANPFDGQNVVLHEFAHQLDQEDGETDGIPLLGRGKAPAEQAGMYTVWAKMLSDAYEELRQEIEKGNETVMDSYGGSDPVEFFAVATECFFEKPKQLRKKRPGLYAALKEFYRQDPATWDFSPKGVNTASRATPLHAAETKSKS